MTERVSIEDVERLARLAGFSIEPAHRPGVAANLSLLCARLALLSDPPIDAAAEPAAVFAA